MLNYVWGALFGAVDENATANYGPGY